MGFEGFSADSLRFLEQLAEHNEKAWFDENRDRYEEALLGREKEFVSAIGRRLVAIRPQIEAVPRVNGSIFRINRDTRFSKDKTPYKTHADMWFWEGEDRKRASGFFVRIVPEAIWVGAGAHMLDRDGLDRMRAAIADEVTGSALVRILDSLESDGYEAGEQSYKRVPKGYPADHPRSELLRFGSLAVMRSEPVPEAFTSPAFVDWCMERFERTAPLHAWLVDALAG